MACFILHNICRKHRVPLLSQLTPSPAATGVALITTEDDDEAAHEFREGRSVRATIVTSFA